MEEKSEKIDELSQKTIKVVGISIIMVLLTLLVLYGFKVILLIIAGLLLSIFFRGIAHKLRSWLPINEVFSLVLSVLLVAGVIVGASFFLSPRISSETQKLKTEIPKAIEEAKAKVKGTTVGDFIINRTKSLTNGGTNLQEKIMGFFNSVFGVIGDAYVIFFLGMFFMAQPKVYRDGIVCLFPYHHRERAEQVLLTSAYTIKRWLLGKLISMLIVTILTSTGLMLLGIPMAFTLGIFAGLLDFIPNFGPLIAFIPAGLMAFTQGFDYALYTAFLYLGIQTLESNLINPLIQRKMISFPMAAILIAQILLAVFTGALGILLAVPIVAIVMVVVKMLYLEDVLKDNDVKVKGEKKFK